MATREPKEFGLLVSLVGEFRPVKRLKRVLLPAPEGPQKAVTKTGLPFIIGNFEGIFSKMLTGSSSVFIFGNCC